MNVLQLAIFESVNGRMLADWSSRAQNTEFRTNEHGFASLSATIRLEMPDAFYWYDRPGLPWIEVNDNADLIWRGRLEDVRLVPIGISIGAFGAWSALADVSLTLTPTAMTTVDVIAADMLDAARTANPTLFNASTWLLQDPGITVHDEDYEDADIRQELTRLAALGDSQTPPRQWEVGFWEAERLHLRPRGEQGATWYVDASSPEIERSLSRVWNSVYARYDGGTTVTATNSQSVTRYGVTRRRAMTSRTTNGTAAERERDALLADNATPIPRARVPIRHVFTAAGTPAPLYRVRSGDTIVLRNLPPEAGSDIDRIRSFRIAETRYRCDDNTLDITPESPLPEIDVLLARALEVPR